MDNRHNGIRPRAQALAKSLTALAIIMLLSACGVTDRVGKRVDDTWAGDMLFGDNEKVILTSDGGNHLNPDESGKPLSVVLHIYQLNTLERFASIDADSLWSNPQKALGNTLIESKEITLLPGMGQIDQWPLDKAAGYVGIAAFFRNDEKGRWKVAFDANSLRKDGIWFSSDGLRVLVDNDEVKAMRGVNVLVMPRTEEPRAEKTLTQRVGDAAAQQTQDTTSSAAQKTADSKVDTLLEGAK